MFERFTDRARRVVVLAQEEARLLKHNYIGTEHILLGLLAEGESVASLALRSLDIPLEELRRDVEERIGTGSVPPSGHVPFTPPAKKVLELSHREALQLGHNAIGSEHLLLGLAREDEGVAAQVLMSRGADLNAVRQKVIEVLASGRGDPAPERVGDVEPVAFSIERSAAVAVRSYDPASGPLCSMCKRPLLDTATYRVLEVESTGEGPRRYAVLYCGNCGDTIKTTELLEEN